MQNDLNILAWYDSLEKQNHRKWWGWGDVFRIIEKVNYLPPFQVVREIKNNPIQSLNLVDFNTGVVTDILNQALSTGLQVKKFQPYGYDLITYPSTVALQLNLPPGSYYLVMSDGISFWYSEVFCMAEDVSKFIKIEYWHQEQFAYPGGHIQYDFPYKSRLYVASDVARPSYRYEEDVVRRDGYNFPVQQICYKVYRFNMLAPEYLLDAMRVIRMHDHVQIHWNGYTFTVDELMMQDADWQEQGHLANVQWEFRTNTVATVNGRALLDLVYELADGECLPADYNCAALLVEGSAEYTGGYYTQNGNDIPLSENEYIIKQESGSNLVVEQWDGAAFQAVASQNGQIAYDARADEYYFFESPTYKIPYVANASGGVVTGKTYPNSLVEVYLSDGTNEVKVADGLSSELEGAGIEYEEQPGYNQLLIKAGSFACERFAVSAAFLLGDPVGIGTMIIESTFIVS